MLYIKFLVVNVTKYTLEKYKEALKDVSTLTEVISREVLTPIPLRYMLIALTITLVIIMPKYFKRTQTISY